MFIDAHAHLTLSSEMEDSIEFLLQRAEEGGVKAIVNVCVDKCSLEKGKILSSKYPWVRNTAATPPQDVDLKENSFLSLIRKEALQGNLLAIGETGLDYPSSSIPRQKESLLRYCDLSAETDLPIIFHCRAAFDDLFSLTEQYSFSEKAMIHCFTGRWEEAKEALQRNWYLSISGIVTYPKSTLLREVVFQLPLERILIETDSPFLAPQAKRGKKNEPSYIVEIAQAIADIKGISLENLGKATTENACRFFSFPKHPLSV